MQLHSLSYIWLEFTDWHKSCKGGMDRPTGREAHSLGHITNFHWKPMLEKGIKKNEKIIKKSRLFFLI